MAEIATIARPYAEALFGVSGLNMDAAQNCLDAFSVVVKNPDFLAVSGDPKISLDQMVDLILNVSRADSCNGVIRDFLKVIAENRRFEILPEIAIQFRGLKNSSQGFRDAVVYSAFPIDDDTFSELVRLLEKRFSCRLVCRMVIEPELIGGIRAVVGDEVFDASVRSQLERMRAAVLDV